MIYKIDYTIRDMGKFDAGKTKLPRYVVSEDFDDAVKAARKFETDNLTVRDCSLFVDDGNITIARGYKGLASSKTEDAAEAKGE